MIAKNMVTQQSLEIINPIFEFFALASEYNPEFNSHIFSKLPQTL